MQFKLTIPRSATLVPTVRQIAERVAQCAGYTGADAARIAAAVAQAADIVVARPALPGPGGDDSLDIRFHRNGLYLDVWLRYRSDEGDRPSADPTLSMEALREAMDSVEFGREGETAFCRLRRTLPREKADHQCEMPPH